MIAVHGSVPQYLLIHSKLCAKYFLVVINMDMARNMLIFSFSVSLGGMYRAQACMYRTEVLRAIQRST